MEQPRRSREFSEIPPHVFRVTAEIAEYQERAEDVRKMRTESQFEDDANTIIGNNKRTTMSELSDTLQLTDNYNSNSSNSNMANKKREKQQDVSDAFAEHSRILRSLKSASASIKANSRRSLSPKKLPHNCTTTNEGVPLRKPVLAKGFNVQKALQDNPQYFHITAPDLPISRHSSKVSSINNGKQNKSR